MANVLNISIKAYIKLELLYTLSDFSLFKLLQGFLNLWFYSLAEQRATLPSNITVQICLLIP